MTYLLGPRADRELRAAIRHNSRLVRCGDQLVMRGSAAPKFEQNWNRIRTRRLELGNFVMTVMASYIPGNYDA